MIPAYDEEKTIGEVAEGTRKLYPNFDILVINDGSKDRTEAEAKKAGANVVTLPFHAGGTSAVLTGYLAALRSGYDYLVKIDGDGQHKPEDVKRLLQTMIANEADICVGSRYLAKTTKTEEDSIVKIGGRAFSSTIVSNIVRNAEVTDTTSGIRAWNRRALHALARTYLNERSLPDDSVLWLVETITASKKGLRIKEIPIEVLPRMHGKSKSYCLMKMVRYPVRLIKLLIETMR
jgi:glycosyltransferase involved in cell wall biosynthesis